MILCHKGMHYKVNMGDGASTNTRAGNVNQNH